MIPKYCLVHLEFFSETIAEQSCSYNLYDKADNPLLISKWSQIVIFESCESSSFQIEHPVLYLICIFDLFGTITIADVKVLLAITIIFKYSLGRQDSKTLRAMKALLLLLVY